MQVLLGLTLKEEVGLAFTVTNCVVTAETQLVGAGPVTVKVNVLTPEVDQLAVQGPAVVPGAGVHPLQFQAKLDPAGALPVYVSVALPPAQTGEEAEKVEVGGATTFTAAVTGVETQLVGAGPVTVNVIFLTPGVDQLVVQGPAVAPGAGAHPLQFQAKVEPAGAVPVKFNVTLPFTHAFAELVEKLAVGIAFTFTHAIVEKTVLPQVTAAR
jgi:hypothetical protein